MLERLAPLAALLLLPLVAPLVVTSPAPPAAPVVVEPLVAQRPIASLVPEEAVVYLELCGLEPLLTQGLGHPFVERLLATPLVAALLAESEVTPDGALGLAEFVLGRPPLATLRSLAANGAALGLVPTGAGDPDYVLVLHGDDAELTADVLADVFDRLEQEYDAVGLLDEPARRELGADVWELGDDAFVARRDALLLLSNRSGALDRALELAARADAAGMLAHATLRAAHEQRDGRELLLAWADLVRLAADGGDLAELANLGARPGAQAFVGPVLSELGGADALSAWLSIEHEAFELGLRGHGVAPTPRLAPTADARGFGPPPPLAAAQAGDLAQGVVYRDFDAFVNERVALFAPELLPKFSEALTILSLLFGGQDFGEDVLPRLSPWLRIVVREPAYDPGRVPENPLPALALIAELADPERDGEQWITAFQTLIGITNADRAQKREGTMRLRLGLEGDVEITSASFLTPAADDGVDLRYNLQPACAVAGGALVLGTHEDVVRSVVRDLVAGEHAARERDPAGTGLADTLQLSGAGVGRVLARNLETLVMQKVLDEGVTHEEATVELTGLVLLSESIDTLRAEVRPDGRATLRVLLAEPR